MREPDATKASHPEVLAMAKSMMASMEMAAKDTSQGKREVKVMQMVLDEAAPGP